MRKALSVASFGAAVVALAFLVWVARTEAGC